MKLSTEQRDILLTNITSWTQERIEVVQILRELCKEFGDNDWQDNDHLRDVIEKHLAKYLWKKNG